jgi:hypothetical protein
VRQYYFLFSWRSLSRVLLSQGLHSRQPTLSCKPASLSRHSLHYITFHSFPSRTFVSFGLFAFTQSAHTTTNSTYWPSLLSFHFIPFHYFLLQLASLQSTGCPCFCSPALSSGLRAVMLFASIYFSPSRGRLRGGFISPLLARSRGGQQKITPALVRSVPTFLHTCQRCRHFSHSSHRASFRSSTTRSLLTPYLLLADSLLPLEGGIVRLGGSQNGTRPSHRLPTDNILVNGKGKINLDK